MRAPAAGELIELWERALPAPPPLRAAMLLASTSDTTVDQALRLPLGRRDALLLRLRAVLFGDELTAIAPCPACGGTTEFAVSCHALAEATTPSEVDGTSWRLPDSLDLLAISACGSAAEAEALLVERCAGGPVPAQTRAKLAEWIAVADPLAECLFELHCPECGGDWHAPLDIAEFTWAEICVSAQRLLRDVDTLARAYGWGEAEVLALSAARRAAYLRMVRDE